MDDMSPAFVYYFTVHITFHARFKFCKITAKTRLAKAFHFGRKIWSKVVVDFSDSWYALGKSQ